MAPEVNLPEPVSASRRGRAPRSFAEYLRVAEKAHQREIVKAYGFPTLRWLAERLNSQMRHGALTGD
jgi:hypothetical protein